MIPVMGDWRGEGRACKTNWRQREKRRTTKMRLARQGVWRGTTEMARASARRLRRMASSNQKNWGL
jgi:hypothetical protein